MQNVGAAICRPCRPLVLARSRGGVSPPRDKETCPLQKKIPHRRGGYRIRPYDGIFPGIPTRTVGDNKLRYDCPGNHCNYRFAARSTTVSTRVYFGGLPRRYAPRNDQTFIISHYALCILHYAFPKIVHCQLNLSFCVLQGSAQGIVEQIVPGGGQVTDHTPGGENGIALEQNGAQ